MYMRRVKILYLVLVGATSLFVAMTYTVELIYQARAVGLNPFQLALAGSVNQGVSFLAQAPTGALADVYSRRWAIVVGLLLTGTGFLIEGLIPAFAAVLVAQSLWGLGASLIAGADAAWIADELGAEQAGSVYLRATQIGWLATLPGIALSAALGSVRLNLPIAVSGILYLALSGVLAVVMPERHFSPSRNTAHASWQLRGSG
jgi:DHA3 family tetracycline resistance protein-like MFS transporter